MEASVMTVINKHTFSIYTHCPSLPQLLHHIQPPPTPQGHLLGVWRSKKTVYREPAPLALATPTCWPRPWDPRKPEAQVPRGGEPVWTWRQAWLLLPRLGLTPTGSVAACAYHSLVAEPSHC